MSKYWSLKETGMVVEQKFVYTDNLGQNILNKLIKIKGN